MSTLKRWIQDLGGPSFLRQAEAMRHLAALGSEAVPQLRLALERQGPIARLAAIQVLERIADPGATPLLVNSLSDEDPFVREAALIALGEIGMPEAAPFLCRSVLYWQVEAEAALERMLFRHYPQATRAAEAYLRKAQRGDGGWVMIWDDARHPRRPMIFSQQWRRLRELLDRFPDDETASLPIPAAQSAESLPRPAASGGPEPQLLPHPARA
jgi:hypothetical protein